MGKQFVRAVVMSFALIGLLLKPAPAWACSCTMSGAPAQEFGQVDAVFLGEVVAITNLGQNPIWLWINQYRPSPTYSLPISTAVSFTVSDSWKGIATTALTVVTGSSGGGDCGYSFVKGGRYVVYGRQTSDGLYTGICSRTSDLANASIDLTYLNTLPKMTLTPASPNGLLWVGITSLGLLGLAMAAVGGFWLLRRQRRSTFK